MILGQDLRETLDRAAALAAEMRSPYLGLPQLMLVWLEAEDGAEGEAELLLKGLLKDEEHALTLRDHFLHAAKSIAEQDRKKQEAAGEEAGRPGTAAEIQLPDEDRRFLLGLAGTPDRAVIGLLNGWAEERGEEELDAATFLKLLLLNWDKIYPVSLSKLNIQLQGGPDREAADFLATLFSEDYDLNLKYGRQPMLGLLSYETYRRSMMEVLVRRYRQNLLLYGPPGAGRSSVLRRLVEDTAAGNVPRIFQGKRFFEFSYEEFLKELRDPQDLSRRFDLLADYLELHHEIIMVADKVNRFLVGENPVFEEFLRRLFRLFERKRLHFIVLADVEFYNNVYKANPHFEEILAPLYVTPLSRGEVIQILEAVKDRFEKEYGIEVGREQVERIVEMSGEHIKNIHYPKKALILLDVALSVIALDEHEGEPDWEETLKKALSRITGRSDTDFPGLSERLERLEESLRERIIGQDPAVEEVCRTIRFMKGDLDINPERPDGVFLFAGPSGVGKQLFASELSRLVYGREAFLVDCSDFQDAESLQSIIGRRSRGEGYPERCLLDRLREDLRRVMVLKNIEYAASEVLKFFMQGFEDGHLNDAAGQRIPVGEMTVILLSDLVGMEIGRGSIGFVDRPQAGELNEDELRDYFTSEMLRSVDKLVVFQPLSEEALLRILCERIVPSFSEKVGQLGHRLKVSRAVSEYVAQLGSSLEYNARNVDRKFDELVAERVNEEILSAKGTKLNIKVSLRGGQVRLVASPMR